MKTYSEVIYDFKDFLDAQELSDEVGTSNRFIINHLLNARATLLKRKKVNQNLSSLNYQTLTLSLEETNDTNVSCAPGVLCTLSKSIIPIPTYIELESITSPINTSSEVIKYTSINPDVIKWKQYSQLPSESNSTYYYERNINDGVYIYLYNKNGEYSKSISITGIFYHPHLVQSINDCDGVVDPCVNFLTTRFPIDPELLTDLYSIALNLIMKGKSQTTDTLNDGNNTNVRNQVPIK